MGKAIVAIHGNGNSSRNNNNQSNKTTTTTAVMIRAVAAGDRVGDSSSSISKSTISKPTEQSRPKCEGDERKSFNLYHRLELSFFLVLLLLPFYRYICCNSFYLIYTIMYANTSKISSIRIFSTRSMLLPLRFAILYPASNVAVCVWCVSLLLLFAVVLLLVMFLLLLLLLLS